MNKSNRIIVIASYIVIFSAWFVQSHFGDGPAAAKAQLTPQSVQMQAVSPKTVSALQLEVAQLKAKVDKLESVIRVSSNKVEIKTNSPLLEISGNTVKIKSTSTLDINAGAPASVRAPIIKLN